MFGGSVKKDYLCGNFHITMRLTIVKVMLLAVLMAWAAMAGAQEKKEQSKENINTWLNSPQIQEWASKPELQAFISMFAKQIFVVNGRLFGTDEFEPKPYPLQGAHVEVKCVGDTAQVFAGVSNSEGEFLVPIFLRQRLKSNLLHIKISYVGMDGVDQTFTPKEVKLLGQKVLQVEMDSLVLHSNPMTLAEAEVIGELQKMYQKGDTVIFNADAYEMPSGSVLLDLVRRLPGLQYIGGKLTYMNRDIEEIRLNGDNFFKRDMGIALQNMPPEKLKSLKVYEVPDDTLDVMSEQHLVMDMNTKEKTNGVRFGNFGVGVTSGFDHFAVNGDVSLWKKNGGQTHLNFNTSDIPSAGAMREEEVRTSAGGSYEQKFGETKVEGGANYGYNRSEARSRSYNKLFMQDFTQNSESESRDGSKSRSYSGNVKLDGHWGKNTYWNTRADVAKSERSGWNSSTDSISTDVAAISSTRTRNSSESDSKEVNWRGGITQYVGETRQSEFGLNASFGFRDSESTQVNTTTTRFHQMGDSMRVVNHVIDNPSKNTNVRATARFRHRFGEFTNLGVNYDVSFSRNSNSQTYNDLVDEQLQMVDSLHYDNKYKDMSHGASVDFKYDDKKVMFQFYGKAHPTVRSADNEQFVRSDHHEYSSVQYQANAKLEVKMHNQKNKLTLNYNGSNTLPSPTDISSAVDYSNPMNIRIGNPKLKEAFRHQMGAEYQLGSLLRLSSGCNWTDNQHTTLSVIDYKSGVRTSTPMNINGNWGANSYVFVTKAIGDVTVAGLANYAYNHSVSYVQESSQLSPVKSASDWQHVETQAFATYSNKSVMLIVRANYAVDHNKNGYTTVATNGKQAGGSMNVEYTLPLKVNVKLKSDINYTRMFGYELESANRGECIWNASAEYKFLNIVTASLEWRDILHSQRGFTASMMPTGWSEQQRYGNTSLLLLRLAVKMNGFR